MANNNDVRKSLEQRLQGSAGALPSGNGAERYLPGAVTGAAAEKLGERISARQNNPLIAYLVFDSTGSMSNYIDAVHTCIEQVGQEILDGKRGIEACVLSVSDHCEKSYLQKQGVRMLGDYGQDNAPTTSVNDLHNQIKSIINTSGGDGPEAYECLAADLTQKMYDDKQKNHNKKQVIVFFGDSVPHGKRSMNDDGCPHQRNAAQLVGMTAMATHTYFVDCAPSYNDEFKTGTYQAAGNTPKTTYLRFESARSVLGPAIIGMIKKEESPEALRTYLAALPTYQATKVAGLLGKS